VYGRKQDTFTAIPTHLYYIMCELLKNSCRATVEHARSKGQLSDDSNASTLSHGLPHGLLLPSVKVIIARGREDMTIKVYAMSQYSSSTCLVALMNMYLGTAAAVVPDMSVSSDKFQLHVAMSLSFASQLSRVQTILSAPHYVTAILLTLYYAERRVTATITAV
jgi:hypothetical protein